MLHFFKKTGNPASSDDTDLCTRTLTKKDDEVEMLPENLVEKGIAGQRRKISKELNEILADMHCLSYFIQFLEIKNFLPAVKFYLDVESFKSETNSATALLRRKTVKRSRRSSDCCKLPSVIRLNPEKCCGKLSNTLESDTYHRSLGEINIMCNNRTNSKSVPMKRDEASVDEIKTHKKNLSRGSFEDLASPETVRILSVADRDGLYVCDNQIVKDAIQIYKKYLYNNSSCALQMPSIVSKTALDIRFCYENGEMHSSVAVNCFDQAQSFILQQFSDRFLAEFLESRFYHRYCMDVLVSDQLGLVDILNCESALFYFMEYLEQEHDCIYLEFWMTATNFRRHYESQTNSIKRIEAQNDAMIIYEKYFSLQVECPLHLPDNIRSHIEERICSEDGIIDCFNLALSAVEGYLHQRHFNKFLVSSLFASYLKEVQKRTNNSESSLGRKNNRDRREYNVIDSRYSDLFTTQSCSLNESPSNMQHSDPDQLWKRKSNGKNDSLILGRVDSLGRYKRNFEPSHLGNDKFTLKSGYLLPIAAKKLITNDRHRAQEEIAWKVAETIIKDVTYVTMGNFDK